MWVGGCTAWPVHEAGGHRRAVRCASNPVRAALRAAGRRQGPDEPMAETQSG